MTPTTSFLYEDRFYDDVEELIEDLLDDLDFESAKKEIESLEEGFTIDCEETTLEKIFVIDEKFVIEAIQNQIGNRFEDRFSEYPENEDKDINEAIRQSVDLVKLNELLPSLYYPNGKRFKITKQDLLNCL